MRAGGRSDRPTTRDVDSSEETTCAECQFRGSELALSARCRARSDLARSGLPAGTQSGQLALHHLLVRLLVLTGLAGAPAPGHDEDEREEDDLAGDAHPPPRLPLVRVVLRRLLNLRAVVRQELQVLGR